MTQINIAEAKTKLSKLVQRALAGEEIFIARGNKPLVRLQPLPEAITGPRQPGSGKGQALYVAPDFDVPLEDFADYSR